MCGACGLWVVCQPILIVFFGSGGGWHSASSQTFKGILNFIWQNRGPSEPSFLNLTSLYAIFVFIFFNNLSQAIEGRLLDGFNFTFGLEVAE